MAPEDRSDCPQSQDIPAWLQGQLTASEAALLREHCLTCALCQAERLEMEGLLQSLGGLEPPRSNRGPRTERVRDVVRKAFATVFGPRALGQPGAAFAGLAIAAALLLWLARPGPLRPPKVEMPLRVERAELEGRMAALTRWLASTQAFDGSFPAWPGARGVGLVAPRERAALGLLALSTASPAPLPAAERKAIEAAAKWLALSAPKASAEERLERLARTLIERRFASREGDLDLAAALADDAGRALREELEAELARWRRELGWARETELVHRQEWMRLFERLGSNSAFLGSFEPDPYGRHAGDRWLASAVYAFWCAMDGMLP